MNYSHEIRQDFKNKHWMLVKKFYYKTIFTFILICALDDYKIQSCIIQSHASYVIFFYTKKVVKIGKNELV